MAGFTERVGRTVNTFIKAVEGSGEEVPKAAQGAFTRLKLVVGQKAAADVESSANDEALEQLKKFQTAVKGKAKLEAAAKKAVDDLTAYFGKDYGKKKDYGEKKDYGQPKLGLKKAEALVCSKCGYKGKPAEDQKCPECGAKMEPAEPEERESMSFTAHTGRILEAVEGTEGLQWETILVEAGQSRSKKKYPRQVLEAAVPLFKGVKCYADHPTRAEEKDRPERSIRDVVGWYENPRFVEGEVTGIGAVLNLLKSEAWFRDKLVEAWERGKSDLITLSINGHGKQKLVRENGHLVREVLSIDSIQSVDAVTEAGAGGRFMRILASDDKEDQESMKLLETITLSELRELRPDLFAEPEPEPEPEPELGPIKESSTEMMQELATLREAVRELEERGEKAARQAKLELELRKSDLPEPIRNKLARHFTEAEFTDEELIEAIREEKEVLAQILPVEQRQFATVRVTKDEQDRFEENLDLLLTQGEEHKSEFRSLKEVYARFTGRAVFDITAADILQDMGQPFNSSGKTSRLREAITSTTWSNIFGTSMTRVMMKEYRKAGYDDWRKLVSSVKTLDDMKLQERLQVGGYGALSEVLQGEDYDTFISPGDAKVTYTPKVYGKIESITLQAIANDDLNVIQRVPRGMGFAAKVHVYKSILDVLVANAAMDYDNKALFHLDHGNKGSAPLDSDSLQAGKIAMMKQMEPVGSGETQLTYLDIAPKYIVVPTNLQQTAWELVKSDKKLIANSNATIPNIHFGTLEDPIVVRHWTDTNDWYLAADPALIATIEVGFYGSQDPEISNELANTGKHFTADQVRYKVKLIYGTKALEHRGLYGAIVA